VPPTVSVNLCCYNGEKYLEEALQSVLLQTYKDWELVMVNDGSTDSTERIIKSHMAAGKPIVYHYQENAGLGSARKKALQLSSGSYIALIDQDDIWLPEKLEKQIRAFEVDQSLGLVYSDSYFIDEDGKELGTAFKRSPPPAGDPFLGLLTHRNFMPCLTVLVRREAAQDVRGFNETLKYVEDYDLFLRIALKYKVSCIPEPLAKYRIHAGNFGGTGSVGMTIETLRVLSGIAEQLEMPLYGIRWRIRKRMALLWCKLVSQCLYQGDLQGLLRHALRQEA
jgi:glycosyltransferase involved in cell wall biosynthesis